MPFTRFSVAAAPAVAAADRPDPSYWTAYDHFMIEREARALRRAYAWTFVATAWRALRRRVAAATPVQRDGVGAPPAGLMHR